MIELNYYNDDSGYAWEENISANAMLGATITKIEMNDLEVHFYCGDDTVYRMWHEGDCCEVVELVDICGEWDDLIGNPLLLADEASNEYKDAPNMMAMLGPDAVKKVFVEKLKTGIDRESDGYDSQTWTFYRFGTIKGSVTLRWFGTSNGYYSERVSLAKFVKVNEDE